MQKKENLKMEQGKINVNNEKEAKLLAEVILMRMSEKELPRIVLEEALKIIDEKFLHDAVI